MTTTPVWVYWPDLKDKGWRKLDRRGSGTCLGIGGRYSVQNSRFNPKLRVIEGFGGFLTAARQKNLRCLLVEDRREVCLRFNSKGEYVRLCTCSNEPLQVQVRDNLIRFIGQCLARFDPARKRKSSGGSGRGSYGWQWVWNPRGDNGFHEQNRESHTPMIGAGGGIGKGGICGTGRHDGNHSGNGGAQGGQGYNTNTPRQTEATGRWTE